MKQDKNKQKIEIPEFDQGEASTIGKRFVKEREKMKLTVDDVAKSLRMRPDVVRELENDDLSSFSHASYARLTLLGYARFLHIPETEVLPWLPEAGGFSMDEHTYLDHYVTLPDQGKKHQFEDPKRPRPNPLVRIFKLLLLFVFFVVIAYAYRLYINMERIQGGGKKAGGKPVTVSERGDKQANAVPPAVAQGEDQQGQTPKAEAAAEVPSPQAVEALPVAPLPEVVIPTPTPAPTPEATPVPSPVATPVVRAAQPVKPARTPSSGR